MAWGVSPHNALESWRHRFLGCLVTVTTKRRKGRFVEILLLVRLNIVIKTLKNDWLFYKIHVCMEIWIFIMFGSCLHNLRVVLYISMPMMMGCMVFHVKHNILVFSDMIRLQIYWICKWHFVLILYMLKYWYFIYIEIRKISCKISCNKMYL